MTTATAHALLEVADLVVVLCPHCSALHQHPASTGRLIPTPAPCDPAKHYNILPTMKPKSYVAAVKSYYTELERKRRIGQEKRDKLKAAKQSSGSSASGSD